MTKMYTYKNIMGKIKRTHGEFSGWTQPTGLLNVRYAIFKNPKCDVLVPEYLLTEETKERIEDADLMEQIEEGKKDGVKLLDFEELAGELGI